jgi:HNH endonuclease
VCGISDWHGRPLVLELDHINGAADDHRLENLRLLCPNCHSQTDTYYARNIRLRRKRRRSLCLPGALVSVPGAGFEPARVSPNEFESFASAIPPPRLARGF